MYKVEQIAKLLNLKPTTIRTWLREGNLEGKRVGKSWVIEADALREIFPQGLLYFPEECFEIEGRNPSFKPTHTNEMLKELYPEEYEQMESNSYHPDPMSKYHEQCQEDLDRRFPYPYTPNDEIWNDDHTSFVYGNEPDAYNLFYWKKYKEEELKLDRLIQTLKEKYGVSDEYIAEIKRTYENLQLLKIGQLMYDI